MPSETCLSTLANAVEIFRLIAKLRRGVTVSDLINHLSLPKSSASRTLSTMAAHGLLDRDATTRAYHPGDILLEAAFFFRGGQGIVPLLEQAVDALVQESGHTGYINVIDGADTLVIHMRTGNGSLQVYTPPGSRAPAFATSMGRAILARLSDDQVMDVVGPGLGVRRGAAPRTQADLLERLAIVRSSGWSLSRGEYVQNVAGISSAIVDPGTQRIYGLGIALPASELSERSIPVLGAQVATAARKVGAQIGDPYWIGLAT